MAHPVSTFQWSDVGYRQLDRDASIHWLGDPAKGDADNKALRT